MKSIEDFVKPKQLPKYFAIDIDHTFYSTDPKNMEKNVDAFKFLISKGVTPFFCTGRNYTNTFTILGEEFFRETGFNGYPGVYCNGSLVYDLDGKIIKCETFSQEFLDKFKTFMYDNQLEDKTIFLTNDQTYSSEQLLPKCCEGLKSNKMQVPVNLSFEDIKKKQVNTIMFPFREININGLRNGSDYLAKYTDNIVAQLTPGKTDKREGLEKLLKELNSNYEECGYIGNGDNDKEPMEWCKLSFAVANAKDDVKHHSTWVLDLTCDQGGFAKVVDLLFK